MKKVLNLQTLDYYQLDDLRTKTINWITQETKNEASEIVRAIDKTLLKFKN